MFGFRFIKAQPTVYLLQYRKGRLVREGTGLSFFYFAPITSLVSIPVASVDMPFIFQEVTSDFQEITIQGQVTYRVRDPQKLSQMLNFALDWRGLRYVSDDPQKLPQRIINRIQVLMRVELQGLSLRKALQASDVLVAKVLKQLTASEDIDSLGIEILGLSILATKPNPETARALEAEVREQLLRESDEAIYSRRNAAVEQERAIKENELNTEIAVENKKRQIRETQMDAERAVQEKKRMLNEERMAEKIALEQKNKELVLLAAENTKKEADAKAYGVSATMKAVSGIDPKIVQALTNVGMEPAQLIASAFQELAGSANKIGELNVSPDMLQELLKRKRK
jgi:regulator of protease activity HflC (stomatin/prohibitin superfamily)